LQASTLYRGNSDFEVLKQIVEEQPPRPRQIDGATSPSWKRS
jgi:hypothetical protein